MKTINNFIVVCMCLMYFNVLAQDIPTNRNLVSLEHNVLFNAHERFTVTQTQGESIDLPVLFDGKFPPFYTSNTVIGSPVVIEISDLPNVHTQQGAWVGWTSRFWGPKNFLVEAYNSLTSSWVTVADYTSTTHTLNDFNVQVSGYPATKFRFTFNDANSPDGKLGLSEIYFLHAEITRPYEGLLLSRESLNCNILTPENWIEGSGNVIPGFPGINDAQNEFVYDYSPYGDRQLVLKATSDDNSASGSSNFDGGWGPTNNIPADITKQYRYTVWMKKEKDHAGVVYFGATNSLSNPNLAYLNGTPEGNPYFFYGDLPEVDVWYLLVGYIYPESHVGTQSFGGIYDGRTGEKVRQNTDYKFTASATSVQHRSFLYASEYAGNVLRLWNPKIEEIGTCEQDITSMLGSSAEKRLEEDNLFPIELWTPGTGIIYGLERSNDPQNSREYGASPSGNDLLWKATADNQNLYNGGWDYYFPVDNTKTYRIITWVKRTTDPTIGQTYVGTGAPGSIEELSINTGTRDPNNPYFWYGQLPEQDVWYLVVGYVHPTGSNPAINSGAVYDGRTGKKVNLDVKDFRHSATATQQRHRAYLYYSGTTAGAEQYFAHPRIDEVNGAEPTIGELLSVVDRSIWNLNNDVAYYDVGSVGIGTDSPEGFKLAVAGEAIAVEVKVKPEVEWPDYVFEENFQLPALEEIEKFVSKNKHLPDIPSAKDVQQEGIRLGEMDSKLLQKIEELTLYLIQQDKRLKNLEDENRNLKKQLLKK